LIGHKDIPLKYNTARNVSGIIMREAGAGDFIMLAAFLIYFAPGTEKMYPLCVKKHTCAEK
jgi:hypothetical protein